MIYTVIAVVWCIAGTATVVLINRWAAEQHRRRMANLDAAFDRLDAAWSGLWAKYFLDARKGD